MTSIDQLRTDGWGNCQNAECGYFFKKTALTHCPACRTHRDAIPTFNQPAYEPPSLS